MSRLGPAGLRAELRAWLRRRAPSAALRRGWDSPDAEEYWEARLRWHRELHRGGWIGVDWPAELGGRGESPRAAFAVAEELGARGLPWGVNRAAIEVAGPAVMRWGETEQKARWLPPMLDAREIWCLCVTEPESGSDFASAAATARPDGGRLRLDGLKRWSTAAHRARRALVLARTDPDARRPWLGLSWLVVDMKAPGVTVLPLRQATGQSEFCEVRFEGVSVPRSDVLGPLNGAWRLSPSVMARESLLGCDPSPLLRDFKRLLEESRGGRGLDAERAGLLAGELAALRGLFLRALDAPGEEHFGALASVVKLAAARVNRDLHAAALDAGGLEGLDGRSAAGETRLQRWLTACAGQVARGTTEIHRELLRRGPLGLRGEDA